MALFDSYDDVKAAVDDARAKELGVPVSELEPMSDLQYTLGAFFGLDDYVDEHRDEVTDDDSLGW